METPDFNKMITAQIIEILNGKGNFEILWQLAMPQMFEDAVSLLTGIAQVYPEAYNFDSWFEAAAGRASAEIPDIPAALEQFKITTLSWMLNLPSWQLWNFIHSYGISSEQLRSFLADAVQKLGASGQLETMFTDLFFQFVSFTDKGFAEAELMPVLKAAAARSDSGIAEGLIARLENQQYFSASN